jgi:hypothetical protein
LLKKLMFSKIHFNKTRAPAVGTNIEGRPREYMQGILKGGSITVPLTSCLTALELDV